MEPGYHIPRNGRDRELGSERTLLILGLFLLFLCRIWDSGNGSDSENDDQNVDELW